MISGISANTPATDPSVAKKPADDKVDPLANKTVFLQLLVAQIKNQDPTKPQDGLQFVTQLAQFSGLEQALTTNKELEAIHGILGAPPPADTTGTTPPAGK